ncbi:chorismate mutase [Rhodoblastus sp.]|uniref:chorismate mutase n=1 Tax=Rhodoblastus sp. TaxID=1962975 RepID=UPI0035B470C3
MAALRARIDTIDAGLVDLFAERQRCIEMAAEIKTRIGWPARIQPRVDEVLDRVTARAQRQDLDPELARGLWTALVEWSIAYEERLMDNSSDKKVDPA